MRGLAEYWQYGAVRYHPGVRGWRQTDYGIILCSVAGSWFYCIPSEKRACAKRACHLVAILVVGLVLVRSIQDSRRGHDPWVTFRWRVNASLVERNHELRIAYNK